MNGTTMALVKVQITIEHTGETLKVDSFFNPEEYTISKDNNYASQSIPGLSAPILQFANGNMSTLEMELLFDTFLPVRTAEPRAPRDVRDETNKIVKLLDIDSDLHAPPVLLVSWATLQFRCVLARVSQKFLMFLDDGRPVRAKLNVTFNEFIDGERELKEVNRQTADFSKAHTVIQGETLGDIASRFYGSPQIWRPIAVANGIDDPRAISTGQLLLIPSLPYTERISGEVIE